MAALDVMAADAWVSSEANNSSTASTSVGAPNTVPWPSSALHTDRQRLASPTSASSSILAAP